MAALFVSDRGRPFMRRLIFAAQTVEISDIRADDPSEFRRWTERVRALQFLLGPIQVVMELAPRALLCLACQPRAFGCEPAAGRTLEQRISAQLMN